MNTPSYLFAVARRLLARYGAALALVAAVCTGSDALAAPVRTIGIVADGPGFDRDGLIHEVTDLVAADFDVVFPEAKILFDDGVAARADAQLDALMADPEVDLIVALGVVSSQVATHKSKLTKPVVAPYVVDPVLQQVSVKDGGSGRANLAYLTYPNTMDRDLRALHALTGFHRVAVIVHAPFLATLHALPVIPAADELGFAIDVVPVDGNPRAAIDQLGRDVDAVYLTPLPAIQPELVQQFAARLIEARLPSFSSNGLREVELGLLAGLNDSNQLRRLTRRTAFVIQEILLGRDPSTMPVFVDPPPTRLSINVATADALGLALPADVYYDANLVGAPEGSARELALRDAVTEALANNLGLSANTARLQSADAGIGRARSVWLPQIRADGGVQVVDPKRVDASLGTLSEVTESVGLSAQQLVFSDGALANLGAQRDLRDGRDAERSVAEADLAHQVSVAWTLVQRAGARLALHLNDVRRVEQNLGVARSRQAIGQVTSAEVARWEAEAAQAKRLVVDARAGQRQAQIGLNLLLGRALDGVIAPAAGDGDGAQLPDGFTQADLDALLGPDPAVQARVDGFLIDLAIGDAPELVGLDAAHRAQQRALGVAKRASVLPTVAIGAQVNRLYRPGFEAFVLAIPVELPGPPATPAGPPTSSEMELSYRFPRQPDVVWSIGATATVPLFSGGAHDADRREARDLLVSLDRQRSFDEQMAEQRVLTALAAARGAYEGRKLAAVAAEAAERTLDWATQGYAQGLATQVQLLEARNTALNANLGYRDAGWVLATELLDLERAINRQHAAMDDQVWTAFTARLRAVAEGTDG